MIESVIGVTIWTDDLERLLKFYRDTLGLKLRGRHGDFVNFAWGDMRLNLGLHDRVKGHSRDPYRIMISFGISDIHAEYRRLVERGVEFIRVPEQEFWGGWVATFLDPDGNILQFLERPKDQLNRRRADASGSAGRVRQPLDRETGGGAQHRAPRGLGPGAVLRRLWHRPEDQGRKVGAGPFAHDHGP